MVKAWKAARSIQYRELFDQLHELSERVDFIVKVTEAPQYRRYVQWKSEQGQGNAEADTVQKQVPGLRVSRAGLNSDQGFGFVDYLGNTYPSGLLNLVAGEVGARTIVDIYRDSSLFRLLRILRS